MHFDLPSLVDSYGYLAVAIGAFLEGETILALGGLAAKRGYLDFATVCAIAAVCGFIGDQFFFYLGRFQGTRILHRFPELEIRAIHMDLMLTRWQAPLIVMIRFAYGFRIAGPVLLGMGRCAPWKFAFYNAIGAAIWAPLVAGAGYLFGAAMEQLLNHLEQAELWAFVVLAVGVMIALLLSRR